MKCISCETEINPKWKHAIDINVCPFCGKHIMEEHLKNLFSSLGSTMEQLQQYPDQLNDWLLSNYNYIKTDSVNLKNYLPKEIIKELRKEIDDAEFQEKKHSIIKIKTPDGGEQEVMVEKTQSESKTNSFFERAEVLKPGPKEKGKEMEAPKSVAEKTQHLKKIAQQIKREGSQGIINEGGLVSMISPSAMSDADPDAVAEYQAIIGSGDIVASGLPSTATGDDDEIPSVVVAMANRANNKRSDGGVNEKDLQSLHEMQSKIQGGARRMNSGKGGFSRT